MEKNKDVEISRALVREHRIKDQVLNTERRIFQTLLSKAGV